MQDWGGGYVTDVEYDDGFYVGQTPTRMIVASAINGIEPPDISEGFAYCELGCGRGGTGLLMAAAHPGGEFHCFDFNPAHIAYAQAKARAAGLTNITFHELSFADLTGPRAPALPIFDFITMHGVWTWIAPHLQQAIVTFIDQSLRPGGLVYVSYNAMPGWSSTSPLQRLVKELASEVTGRSDVAAERAIGMLGQLVDIKAIPERMHEGAALIQRLLDQQMSSYIAHEYLNDQSRPAYHFEVAEAFAGAKLTFAGSTDLLNNFQNVVLTAAQHEFISGIASPSLRETLKDFCADTRFRTDVFVRGARRMSAERRETVLRSAWLTLIRHPPEAFHLTMPDGSGWRPEPAVYGPVLAALKTRPHRVAELLTLPDLPADHGVAAVELIGILAGANLATLYVPPTAATLEAAARLNAVNMAEPAKRKAFVAVPAIGGGFGLAPVDLILYGDLARQIAPDPEDLARRFIATCVARGGPPSIDGKPIEDPAEAQKLIAADYAERVALLLPLWKMMHVF